MAKIAPDFLPEYCVDHKVWYDDYLRRENLLIEQDETPDFAVEVAVRKKTLFVTCLPYNTKISNIISFFRDVGEVVRVRLIVNHRGERMGCGFVEFASANKAKKAKNSEQLNHAIFLYVVEIAPYPLRPKYNLAEKLWNEDYFRRFGEDYLESKFGLCSKKIIFSYDDDDEW